jgi:protein SCO1/2
MKIIYLFIGLLACALGLGIAQYMMPNSDPAIATNSDGSSTIQVIPDKLGGDFTLMQDDTPVKLSDFQGKLVVMYFGFASCPDVCPTTLTIIASALRELTPEELEQVQPIFISIDPERDQGENLMAYATYFHPSFIGITGTADEVTKVANQYGAFFFKSKSDSAMDYTLDHTSKTYLVSEGGKYMTILPHDMTRDNLLEAIREEL